MSRLPATADEVPVPNVALASPRAQQLLRASDPFRVSQEAAVLSMPQTASFFQEHLDFLCSCRPHRLVVLQLAS